MKSQFTINGMTCNSCKQKVTELLGSLKGVHHVAVDLEKKLVEVESDSVISPAQIAASLQAYPKYSVAIETNVTATEPKKSWWNTYKPVLLLFIYLILICTGVAWITNDSNIMHWMNNFMAGFFLVFSFFKLLNISGFANSYAMYDVIAKNWRPWGYMYPFIELGLGFSFLLQLQPVLTNSITFVVMSISLIGVVQSVLQKKKIKCACLGDVFNLPMSTVTIIEDSVMILMSLGMLVQWILI